VEEITKELEENFQQKIDERLAEQREIETLDEGRYMYSTCTSDAMGHKSNQCLW